MRHNPAGASAAGYRDPTTLFEESDSASSTTSTTDASDADYRAMEDLMNAAPGLMGGVDAAATAAEGSRPRKSAWSLAAHLRAQVGQRVGLGIDGDSPEAAAARAEWWRRQRERQERRFFRERGALDFEHSAVFTRGDAAASPGGQPSRRAKTETPIGADSEAESQEECVPGQLQAWYVASNSPVPKHSSSSASPAATASRPGRRGTRPLPLKRTRAKAGQPRDPAVDAGDAEEDEGAGWEASFTPTGGTLTNAADTRLEHGFSSSAGHGGGHAGSEAGAAGNALEEVIVRPSVRSSGAGTTSVNVLQSRPAFRAGDGGDGGGAVVRLSPPPRRLPPPPSAADASAAVTPATGAAVPPARGSTSVSDAARDSIGEGSGTSGAADTPDKADATEAAAAPTLTASHGGGGAAAGRPPLRAHRYVEQPNGLFLDHAQHADLLAQYGVEEELRHAQAKEEARRARRWARLLYGRSGEEGRRGGGRRQDGTTSGAASASASGTAMAHSRFYWLYDAATYRPRFVSTLRYLQRVHVFLGALAAGVALLALLAMTVPFPAPYTGGDSEGGAAAAAASARTAVLLLALLPNISASPAAAGSGAGVAAQLLPVLETGHPAAAVFLALLQPYHTALMLCLCLLLVITGYAPVPWGVAERYWMVQRRRWLRREHADGDFTGGEGSVSGGGAARRRVPGGRPRSGSAGGNVSSDDNASSSTGGGGGGGGYWGPRSLSTSARRAAAAGHRPRHAGMDAHVDEASRSVLFATASSPLSRDDALGISAGGTYTNVAALMRDELLEGAGHTFGGAAATYTPYNRHRRDPLNYSLSLGASYGHAGLGATYGQTYGWAGGGGGGPLSSSLSNLPSYRGREGSYTDAHYPGFDGAVMEGTLLSPSNGNLSSPRGRSGASGGGTARFNPLLAPRASVAGSPNAGHVSAAGRHALPQWRLRGAALASPLAGAGGAGRSAAVSSVAGGASRPRGAPLPPPLLLFPACTLEGGLSADNFLTRTADYAERRAMQWLCNTLRQLTRACWRGCGAAAASAHGARNRRSRSEGEDGSMRYRESAGVAAAAATTEAGRALAAAMDPDTHRSDPVVPASLYLHVLLQPRLWCVVTALALTLVEIAFVDERSVELMWLAQPSSWWAADSTPPVRRVDNDSVVLPHAWTTVNVTPVSTADLGGGGVVRSQTLPARAAAAPLATYDLADSAAEVDFAPAAVASGRVWRVVMGVYATRMAVLWIAFLLNLFF